MGFKIIIAGGRDFNNYELLDKEVTSIVNSMMSVPMDSIEFVSGGAKGADSLGEKYAKANNFKLRIFPANWDKHGKAAGPIRNRDMAEYADMLIVFWDGRSRGTRSMIREAKHRDLEVHIIFY